MSDVVIKAEHLSKMYKLGVINNGTLWKDFQTWFALKSGKEDPHSLIGTDRFSGDLDHFWALKDLNFDIKQGDRVGIIGKNGAGKSTLLKILSRITSPTEGVVRINGKISSLLEVGTGFHGELTGRENIYLNGAILGMKKRQIDRKLEEIIDFSEIEHHIDTPVKRYSSGMFVRLAFAVAAHLDSDILIADEVLAVGDAAFQKKALGKMNDLSAGQGRTVLFVSHNTEAIRALCSTGIFLEKGRIVSQGNISELIDTYLGGKKTTKLFVDHEELISHGNTNFIEPLCLALMSESLEGNDVLINKEIQIETEYVVKFDNLIAQVSIHLVDSQGNTVFASFNEPSVSLNQCEFHGKPYSKGKYKTICKIPPFFLNEGSYSINYFLVTNRNNIETAVYTALNFYVRDTGEMREEYAGFWIGSIRPKLFWDTQKL